MHPPQSRDSDSNADLFKQVEAFKGGEEEDDVIEETDSYESDEGDLSNETSTHPHHSSTNADTSTSGTHFVCTNCVLHMSIKRVKYLSHQFYLLAAIIKPGPNDRPDIPPPHMAAFLEAIIRGGASLPLHPFIVEVLDYLNVTPLFTQNSIRTMVAFYIAFMEADIGELSIVEFGSVYCIKVLAKNERLRTHISGIRV